MGSATRRLAQLALATVAACGDPGAPGGDLTALDAPAVSANLQAVDRVLQAGVWESFRSLAPRFTAAGPAAGLGAAMGGGAVAELSADGARAAALRLGRALLAVTRAPAFVPRLPPEVRGITFVLDSVTLQYVPDPGRSGAPANGVRFILYAVDTVTSEPLPGVEIGYADLMDEGDALPAGIAHRIRVVSGGITHLDYFVTAGGTDSTGALHAAGFVTDGTTRVELQAGISAGRTGDTAAMEVRFAIGIPDRAFQAAATVRNVDAAGGSVGEIALDVQQGETRIGLALHGGEDSVIAEFRVNGELLATAQGDGGNPVIRGADGRELTLGERQALSGILELAAQVFAMFDCLMRPVAAMLGVGVGVGA